MHRPTCNRERGRFGAPFHLSRATPCLLRQSVPQYCESLVARFLIGEVLSTHDNVRHLFFGHVHRSIADSWQRIPYSTLRSTNHQCRAYPVQTPRHAANSVGLIR